MARTEISSNYKDGYFAIEAENGQPRVWWINDGSNNPGASPPARPSGGVRHYIHDTGFAQYLEQYDRNPEQFKQIASQWLGVTWERVGAMTVSAPPPMGGGTGGGGGGGFTILGDMKELIDTIAEFVPALTAPPIPPPVVAGDIERNFKNLFAYSAALEAHFRRDESIRVLADAISLAFARSGISSIRTSELARVVGGGLSVLATPIVAPEVVPLTGADPGDGTGDRNFKNFFAFLDANAKWAKRDELVRAVADTVGRVLAARGQ